MNEIISAINTAWTDRKLLNDTEIINSIKNVIELLDKGKVRIAEPTENGWKVNGWIKKAVILYFPIQKMEITEIGPFEFYDKIKLKRNYDKLNVRVVPHAIARYGSYLAKGVIMMPSYVNE